MTGGRDISSNQGISAAFEMENVSFRLDGKDILRDLTLTARESRVGIVGRNGSGKTTFARVLAGLVKPTAGSVKVLDVDVATDRKAALKTVGILFQNPDHQIIFPTVEEEMAFGLLQQGLSKQVTADRVAEILTAFGKTHWAAAAIHGLSQGQKQLVCLMSIVAMAPKVIVLDEPFSGLDIPTRIQLSRYLDNLSATVVQISHDPENLQNYERIIWLENGAMRMDGEAQTTLKAFDNHMKELGGQDDISDLTG